MVCVCKHLFLWKKLDDLKIDPTLNWKKAEILELNEKGIKLNRESLALEVVPTAGNEGEILIHDERNKVQAQLIAEMKGPNFPIAVGVLYREEKSSFVADVYEKLSNEDQERASLQALLESGQTWQVK